MLLRDKSAIVTGAAGGLGLACAKRLAENGAKVVISDITSAAGEAAAEALRRAGHDARYQDCDVTKAADIEKLVATAVETFGRLDIAVANAGIVKVSDPLEVSEADFDAVLASSGANISDEVVLNGGIVNVDADYGMPEPTSAFLLATALGALACVSRSRA